MTPIKFAELIIVLCFAWSGSVSSWGRTQKHNKHVGGDPNSRHLVWLGIDVVIDGMEGVPVDLRSMETINNINSFIADCKRYGLKAFDEKDHIHVQTQ